MDLIAQLLLFPHRVVLFTGQLGLHILKLEAPCLKCAQYTIFFASFVFP
jgi:hypothetical protein